MAFLMMPFVRSMSILDICEEWSARRLQDQNGDGSSVFFFLKNPERGVRVPASPAVCAPAWQLSGIVEGASIRNPWRHASPPRHIFEQSSSELAQANSCQQLLTARFSPVLERSGPPQSVGRSSARSLFASAEAAELGGAQRGGRKQLAGANKRSRKGRFR